MQLRNTIAKDSQQFHTSRWGGHVRRELPVFYDNTGRRWRFAKILLLSSVIIFVLSTVLFVSSTLKNAFVPAHHKNQKVMDITFPVENRSPTELAYSMNSNTPVIGSGVFMRVVKINDYEGQRLASDVYSGVAVKILTDEETQKTKDSTYAIERYGSTDGKNLVLTFDDGPDPLYTPQILDLLSAEGAHATFFPIGMSMANYPEITKRIASEGHDVANHTFSHADLDLVDGFRARQEINQTQRILHAVTGTSSALFRIPYGGLSDVSVIDDRRAILEAQQLGYVLASYNIDSLDWTYASTARIPLPILDGKDKIVLVHDGGGNRTATIRYIKDLIAEAKSKGYQVTSLSRLHEKYGLSSTVGPSLTDKVSYAVANMALVWPKKLVHVLFYLSTVLLFFSLIMSIVLAELQLSTRKPKPRRRNYYPLVSIIIPAFNEAKVLKKTVQSLLKSEYSKMEIIIVDDGSTDQTWSVAKSLKRRGKVRSVHKANGGKASAINRGIKLARGELLISIDADTIFMPKTVGRLIKYFYYPSVGAVAGVVKAGNVNNWMTRWQALEYISSIHIERAAQAYIGAVMIAPGACSAWRKEAVQAVGGYSGATMAEDCDLTLAIHKAGYRVIQDMTAIAYTEVPETLRNLAKQRFRWLFGTVQAIWKHRDMIFRRRYGWLGMFVIPKMIFGIFMQLVFTPLLVFVAIGNILSGDYAIIIFYSVFTFIIMLFTALTSLIFAHERLVYLTATPTFRLVYSPLRSVLLYLTVIAVLGGTRIGWNKFPRTGTAHIID